MSMAMELGRLSPRHWLKTDARTQMTPSDLGVSPVGRLHQDVDRWFDAFMSDFGLPGFGSLMRTPEGPSLFRPQLDVVEGEHAYTVTVEIPGVQRDELAVELRENALAISGEKRREQRDGQERSYRVERSYGRFERLLELPDDVDLERIEAHHQDGVLTVTIPRDARKREQSVRRIDVQAS